MHTFRFNTSELMSFCIPLVNSALCNTYLVLCSFSSLFRHFSLLHFKSSRFISVKYKRYMFFSLISKLQRAIIIITQIIRLSIKLDNNSTEQWQNKCSYQRHFLQSHWSELQKYSALRFYIGIHTLHPELTKYLLLKFRVKNCVSSLPIPLSPLHVVFKSNAQRSSWVLSSPLLKINVHHIKYLTLVIIPLYLKYM